MRARCVVKMGGSWWVGQRPPHADRLEERALLTLEFTL
jgi:hypothetical protein